MLTTSKSVSVTSGSSLRDSSVDLPTDMTLAPSDTFVHRHVGPSNVDVLRMLEAIGYDTLEDMTAATVPASIRMNRPLKIGLPRAEHELLLELKAVASENKVVRSCIGMGYSDTITPPVILRNILENPGWYTAYTPYQAEISQGRMEALLNYQTMVCDLTGLPLANASLLDEGTAAAEAMSMARALVEPQRAKFFVSQDCHPQTIAVVRGRAEPVGIEVVVGDVERIADFGFRISDYFGVLVQYPTTLGKIFDYTKVVDTAHAAGAMVIFAADILALTLLKSPGEFGADIAVGSTQRFGVPMGFGGPHAAYMATKTEYARKMPGRIIGVSKDSHGNPALRLTLQTREQHIRREKATSNICTAQVLLAVIAGMYAVYHGPEGLKRIARRTHACACAFAAGIERLGHEVVSSPFFDTVTVKLNDLPVDSVIRAAVSRNYNLRKIDDTHISVAFDETTTRADVEAVIESFAGGSTFRLNIDELAEAYFPNSAIRNPQSAIARTSDFLSHPVFNTHHSETELLRYIFKLMSRDLSLCQSMIPLGSCTMKLNATSEMIPVTWPEFGKLHPFAPKEQTGGYQKLFEDLERWLAEITGFAAVSLQPNAGSQGEYAGLLTIRNYFAARGESHRDVCLIPASAHGTNPASAVIAGFKVVAVACDENGNVDFDDLTKKADEHAHDLGALMVTYPSTHGVFEERIKDICAAVHAHGGQVYMDGANMNAQVGLCRPGDIGADVCHLNLHKTFCIPHGGGGPGMGPIGVVSHLKEFLPTTEIADYGLQIAKSVSAANASLSIRNPQSKIRNLPVSAAPYGSASILPISWVYIALMGGAGLTRATQVAILSANYVAKKLEGQFDVLYKGKNGLVAHECILDCRSFERSANIKVEDIAKRLMDYGFHAPTMSWPVVGTLMIEPTESEPLSELDRFVDAMISIRAEIRAIEEGKLDKSDNPLKHAPHTAPAVTSDAWNHTYSRQQAAYPAPWLKDFKFWPSVGRVDNPYGDRNLVCACPPVESSAD